MSISIIIATIPGRESYLQRAVNSAINQSLKADKIIIAVDNDRLGAAKNRDKSIKNCGTEYVAILDDDDFLFTEHLSVLKNELINNNADLVYPSWVNENHFVTHLDYIMGKEWDSNNIHQIPITWLAKTEALIDVGGFSSEFDVMENNIDEHGHRIGEDFLMIKKMVKANKKIIHVDHKTWSWNCGHGGSTQGRPDRW